MKSNENNHLLDIASLPDKALPGLLSRAEEYARIIESGDRIDPVLSGKVILTYFAESSTRTRVSFTMAAHRLGASVIHWDPKTSALTKNESFTDTIQTLDATGPDAIIIRHGEYNAPHFVATHVSCPVINAGDSWRAHPSQALLDALTIKRTFGKFEGVRVALVGDIAHSRVANSDIALFERLGMKVHVIAPKSLLPKDPVGEDVQIFDNLQDGLSGCDVVMGLRLQKERMEKSLIEDEIAYFHEFGITYDTLEYAKPGARIMHPGPMNRGIEIAEDLPDDPDRSLILKQVANGVPTRMAILEWLLSS
mgnify:CR=1 FL=1